MFEKESEEYANRKCGEIQDNEWKFCKLDWQEGAEFGYNKANEWHRADDGKYPSKEQLGESFIVAFAFNERTQKYYSFDCAEYIDKGKFCTHTNNDDKVIAWKEIVLPELKESE